MSKCSECRFAYPHETMDAKLRSCRRFPPVVIVVPVKTRGINGVQMIMQPQSIWPATEIDAVCGEFQQKVHA